MRQEWLNAKRLVVKIGSSLLADATTGRLKADWLASLSDDIATLRKGGKEVIAAVFEVALDDQAEQGECQTAPEQNGQDEPAGRAGLPEPVVDEDQRQQNGRGAAQGQQRTLEEFVPAPLPANLVEGLHQSRIGLLLTHGSPFIAHAQARASGWLVS